jgi:hypothetical protein
MCFWEVSGNGTRIGLVLPRNAIKTWENGQSVQMIKYRATQRFLYKYLCTSATGVLRPACESKADSPRSVCRPLAKSGGLTIPFHTRYPICDNDSWLLSLDSITPGLLSVMTFRLRLPLAKTFLSYLQSFFICAVVYIEYIARDSDFALNQWHMNLSRELLQMSWSTQYTHILHFTFATFRSRIQTPYELRCPVLLSLSGLKFFIPHLLWDKKWLMNMSL